MRLAPSRWTLLLLLASCCLLAQAARAPQGRAVLHKPPLPTIVEDANPPGFPPATASVPSEVFNLIKTIVGAGVLGLPAGIAAYGNAPSALLPALALMVVIGAAANYAFVTLGLLCGETSSATYQELWKETVRSPRTAALPTLLTTAVCCGSVLTYSMILADTIPALAEAYAGVAGLGRTPALLGLTTVVLLPLCLLRNLSQLAPFSFVGIVGMLYTAVVMVVRWQMGSYAGSSPTLRGPHEPLFGSDGWSQALTSKGAMLMSMLSTAYMAHYNAPKLYWELRQKQHFPVVCTASFAGSIGLMVAVSVAGFATFGGACQGLILQNYSVQDRWMSVSRLAVAVSLICSYPLVFVGVRDGLGELMGWTSDRAAKWFTPLTLTCLAVTTALALVLKDIRVIMAVGGATWGNCVIYILPAVMRIQHNRSQGKAAPVAWMVGLAGLVMGVIGTTQALQSI